ncbi:MAG TPA: cation:proton antiporter [Candidatus Eremiobacteraceae bacterium]|jgi:Kef-type K+ transport system membrane component KefB
MHAVFDIGALQNVWLIAAIWMALALLGSLVSIRFGIAAALVEISLGIIAGNFIALRSNVWIDFVAGFGSIMLTFLAGAEINPSVLKRQWRPAVTIGILSFSAPFFAALAFAFFGAHWNPNAAKIAGIAMSTTSVAVVYAVMIESGLAGTPFGQLILAACFITDLGTVVALGLLFANVNAWLALFIGVSIVVISFAPRFVPNLYMRLGDRVSEPGARFLFLIIFSLSGLATLANSEGVLPAYFLGFSCAGFLLSHTEFSRGLRRTTMSLLTPFYFIKAGTFVSLYQAASEAWVIVAFFAVKVFAKLIAVFPAARGLRYKGGDAAYLTLMMATGLTFGTISSLYGLSHGYITQAQYTTLVTVVILTAIIPTMIAQRHFPPSQEVTEAESGGLEEIEVRYPRTTTGRPAGEE